MITPKVKYVQDAPKPIWLTIDGVHFPLTAEIAFVYNWSLVYNGEEKTQEILRPHIMYARRYWMKKREAAASPQKTAAQIAQ